jgi:transglutaminase-like putative cysteine protease
MTLRDVFVASLFVLVILGSGMLWLGEGDFFPAGVTVLLAVAAYLFNERGPRWSLGPWSSNALGLLAAAAALGEFLGPSLEGRLLSGAHFLCYLSWIILFQKKRSREYWLLGAFVLLLVAVGSVLTNSGLYGLLVLVFVLVMLWTMAVGNLLFRAQELELLPTFLDQSGDPAGNVHPAEIVAHSPSPSPPPLRVRHGVCLEYAGHWLQRRFVFSLARMAILGLIMGVLVFLLVPRFWIGSANPFLNTAVGGGRTTTGYSKNLRLGGLGEILEDSTRVLQVRLFDRDSDNLLRLEELATLQGLDEPYFRGDIFDKYRSGQWSAEDRVEKLATVPWTPKTSGLIRQEYLLDQDIETAVVALRPADLAYAIDPYQPLERGSFTYTLKANEFQVPLREYFVWSRRRPHADLPTIAKLSPGGLPEHIDRRYRSFPQELVRVRELADRVVGELTATGPSAERQIADRLIAFLRDSGEYSYSLQQQRSDFSLDPLEDFLLNTKQGHCEYFATALVIMLRTQGVHSRLVTGYKGAVENRNTGYYEVQRRHSHAWVEAWVDDEWQTLDAVPYARDEETRRFSIERGFWGNTRESLSSLWSNYFVSMSIDRQQSQLYAPLTKAWNGIKDTFQQLYEMLRDFGTSDPAASGLYRQWGPWLLSGLVLSVGLLRWLAQWGSRAPTRARGTAVGGWRGVVSQLLGRWWQPTSPQEQSIRFYQRFEEIVASRGLVRPQGQTQQEFASQIERELAPPLAASQLSDLPQRLTRLFYEVRFGERPLPGDEAEQIEHQLGELALALSTGPGAKASPHSVG